MATIGLAQSTITPSPAMSITATSPVAALTTFAFPALVPETSALLATAPADTSIDKPGNKVYHIKVKYELPAAALFIVGSSFGFKELDKVSEYTAKDVVDLDPNDVNGFDRPVIFKDPSGYQRAHERSDMFLNASILSPLILALDKNIRKDWLSLATLYLVTHAVDNTLYFGLAYPIRRARPLTYNTELPVEERIGLAKSNSFFSGHVSFSATSTFFLVKVYTDYHQIKGWKRLALYGAASIPPALVGYYRMEAGRHFKTDVLTGFVIGAASGILVPELHRNKKKEKGVSLSPFYSPQSTGFTMTVPLN